MTGEFPSVDHGQIIVTNESQMMWITANDSVWQNLVLTLPAVKSLLLIFPEASIYSVESF